MCAVYALYMRRSTAEYALKLRPICAEVKPNMRRSTAQYAPETLHVSPQAYVPVGKEYGPEVDLLATPCGLDAVIML